MFTVLRFNVQSDLGVLGLMTTAVNTCLLLLSLEKKVKSLETTLAVGNFQEFLELEIIFIHDRTRAMVTDTP